MPAALPTDARSSLRGAWLMVAAVVVFGLQDGLSRYLTEDRYPVFFVIAVRYWVTAAVILGLAAARGPGVVGVARTRYPILQLLRGLLLAMQVCIIVTSFGELGLFATHSLFATTTLLVAAGGALFLGERVGAARWVAIGLGFCGVLVLMRPGLAVFDPVGLLPLLGACTFASYQLLTRQVARGGDGPGTSFFYTGVGGALVMSFVGPFHWVAAAPVDWLYMLLLSGSSMTAHFLLISAFRHAEASAIQPLAYLQLVVAAVVGIVVFGEAIEAVTVCGAALIVAAGLLNLRLEHARRKRLAGA